MPFCSKCGKQLQEGSKFCNECGAPVDVLPTVPVNNSINQARETRQSSLAEIDQMISYFGQKQAQYDEYDNCVEQIVYYSNPSTVIRINDKFQWQGMTGKPLIFLAIFIIVCGYIAANTGSIIISENGASTGSIIAIIIGIIVIAGGIALLVFSAKKRAQYNKSYRSFHNDIKARQIAEKESLLKQYQDRYDQLSQELDNHFKNYGYCSVAEPYTNPKILMQIREPIYIGRADTIKESMNLLVQDAHNAEMELQAAATAKSAKSAARGANVAAFFTAASFINDLRK